MILVLVAAAVAVGVGVVVVAIGRGGQIAEFTHDSPPLSLPSRRPIAGTDVALLRLPAGPWGYSFRATDDALRRIAHALTERDTRIAVLEQQVSDLRTTDPQRRALPGESPWFDREAPFASRPGRALPSPATDTLTTAAAMPALAPAPDTTATDEPPQDDVQQDDLPQDDVPQDDITSDDTDTPVPDTAVRTEPGDATEDAGPTDDAASTDDADDLRWRPSGAWPKAAEPDAEEPVAESPAAAETPAETADVPDPTDTATDPTADATDTVDADDEDWVFEDDVEPVVEPVSDPVEFVRPARPRKHAPAPAPGDRLVASTHTKVDDEPGATTDEQPHGEGD